MKTAEIIKILCDKAQDSMPGQLVCSDIKAIKRVSKVKDDIGRNVRRYICKGTDTHQGWEAIVWENKTNIDFIICEEHLEEEIHKDTLIKMMKNSNSDWSNHIVEN